MTGVQSGSSEPDRAHKPPVAIFLHTATLGRYGEVAHEMLAMVRASPLYDLADTVQIHIVGDGSFAEAGLPDKVQVFRRSADVTQFEHLTLAAAQAYAREHTDAKVLYLNCLGGRHVGEGYEIRRQWRRLLGFLLIERGLDCLAALDTHDVCGVEWVGFPMPHMTSNNWWARADYLARLPSPADGARLVAGKDLSAFGLQWAEAEHKRRHSGEFWLGLAADVRPYSCLRLREFGLPTGEYHSVPWWGLPGIAWERLARRKLQGLPANLQDVKFEIRAAFYRALFAARRLKRSLKPLPPH